MAVERTVHSESYGYWGQVHLRTAAAHAQAVFRERAYREKRPATGYHYEETPEGKHYTCTDCGGKGWKEIARVEHLPSCVTQRA